MNNINPYKTPAIVYDPLPINGRHRFTRQVAMASLLGTVGYGVYFGSVYAASFLDASVSISDSSWAWGGIFAFAFGCSEMFVIEAWKLKRSLLRRLMVSCVLTIASLIIAGQICTLVGIELRRDRAPLILPRIGMGLPVFLILGWLSHRWLRQRAED